jgi:hypothetical protein
MLVFEHTIYSEAVTINATIEQVWQVLLDLDAYPQWNPFTWCIGTPEAPDRSLRMGTPVDLHVRFARRGERLQQERVALLEPPFRLGWGMTLGAPWLLKALREQRLETVDAQVCRYQTWDAFAGVLAPVVVGLFGKDIQDGFNAVAWALKREAERRRAAG